MSEEASTCGGDKGVFMTLGAKRKPQARQGVFCQALTAEGRQALIDDQKGRGLQQQVVGTADQNFSIIRS